MAVINSMSLRGKVTLAACAVGFLIAVALIFRMATAPSYVVVMSGLDPTKSGEIVSTLTEAGISGNVTGGGTQLQVPKGKEDAAITALASKGLNTTNAQLGFADTLDKQKLGASSIQQKVAYQRGLEGEIAGAISKIEGVGTPNVRLTLPDQTAFVGAEDQPGATAAVVLGGAASTLAPGAVKGIANLVASSVPNRNGRKVTSTDGTGSLVWPNGGSGDSSSKAAAEASRAQATEARINSMLDQTLGANKARVQVTYDLNMNKVSEEKLSYDQKGTPLNKETSKETLEGSGAVPGGTSGSTGNVPGYSGANGSSTSGNNNYEQNSNKTAFGVGKTITKTDVASGSINKMQVGLIVDQKWLDKAAEGSTPESVTNSLKSMVSSAAGVDAARGDEIKATAVEFPATEAAKASPVPAGMLGAIKGIAIAIAAMMFLFFLSRYLRGREEDVLMDEPSWLKQLPRPAGPIGVEAPNVQMMQQMDQMEAVAAKFASDPRKKALQDVVDNEPERVAAHLRSWITEDGA
ncbi:MAG TPA: flagellar basal-body MS-ring/collar protein FliF [Baekduia sp.]|nr:flagellar basal-body MS-ring/collar protein FliF [Baekduia sp.]